MKCRECRHWVATAEDSSYSTILIPYNPITYEKMTKEEYGHEVRYCRSPKILFYERPGKDEACVVDGSQYKAELITGSDFGCSVFEEEDDN